MFVNFFVAQCKKPIVFIVDKRGNIFNAGVPDVKQYSISEREKCLEKQVD